MIWLATSAFERAVPRPGSAIRTSNIPVHTPIPMRHSKRLIRQESLRGFDPCVHMVAPPKPRLRLCLDRQSAMEFKHSNGILFSNKIIFEEPLRHVLIQRRKTNPSLGGLSHIPITELEVQSSDAFHDMIKDDFDLNNEVRMIFDRCSTSPCLGAPHFELHFLWGIECRSRRHH